MYYTSNEIHVRERSTATKAAVLCRVLTFNQGAALRFLRARRLTRSHKLATLSGKSAGDKVHYIYIFFFFTIYFYVVLFFVNVDNLPC